MLGKAEQMNKVNSLGEAIKVYSLQQIIDLETTLGQELLSWFKASSYSIEYYNRCAFIPALDGGAR